MPFSLLFLCFILSAAQPPNVRVTFSSPTLVSSSGEAADRCYNLGFGVGARALAGAPLVCELSSGWRVSVDGGLTFQAASAAAARNCSATGGFDGAPIVSALGGALQSLGVVAHVKSPGVNQSAFASALATLAVTAAPGGLACATLAPSDGGITFTGLPRPLACASAQPVFGCPFRVAGGAALRLLDGTLLYSAIVRWAGGGGGAATSVVAFASGDGTHWTYISTIADAAVLPNSEEGPNENALALLSDGRTVLAVMRLDAGDGERSHPFANYAASTSTDGGMTWTAPAPLANAGCARPKLLHLGSDGAGRVLPAPLLLAGGRHKSAGTSDVLLWVDAAGDGRSFADAISLSFWHNAKALDPSWRFTPEVNDSSTAAERQTMAYTSLVELDGGFVPGARQRTLGVFYNRKLAGDEKVFMMPFFVSW